MIKGLVLFDYDGTLVDEREGIFVPTQRTAQSITELQQLGYLCVLATGRALSYISSGAKDLQLDGYVTSNGANVTIQDKELYRNVFADTDLQELIRFMKSRQINFILESADFCYVDDREEKNYQHFIENFKIPKDHHVDYQNFEQVKQKIEKITLAFASQQALQEGLKLLRGKYACSVHRNCNTFDIGKSINHKGIGAKVIMEHYHIPLKQTYAFGDGDNDIELLDSVGYGIAMGIHDPGLDKVASHITGTVKEDGIYQALKKLGLLK